MLKKIAMAALILIAGLAAVLTARTLALPPAAKGAAKPASDAASADAASMATRLGEAIRFETISWGDARELDAAAFEGFAAFLERAYPAAHGVMSRETIAGHSLLYRWRGEGAGKPIGFIAHIDVVPVEAGTEARWTHPPFAGAVADGAVWGRGAMDDKGPLIALMEAAERLAASGFHPQADIYFMFGHDEELGGFDGAAAVRKTLDERGVRFAFTLDEGSGLVQGVIPGVEPPVALISTAEKGSATLKFTATAPGGHSSAPDEDTAVSLVSRAVVAVTDNPYPLEIDDNLVAFLHAIAPEAPFLQRGALANLWLTGPVVARRLGENPATAATLHTTTAATMIEGGVKENVLPQSASAYVNYRIHPRDSVEEVRRRAQSIVNDARVTVEALGGVEPTPQSPATGGGYEAIGAATVEIFGPVPTAPSLTIGGTDSRHYIGVADGNYRFAPFVFSGDDLERFHGTDERLKIEDLVRAAAWYEALIRRTAS